MAKAIGILGGMGPEATLDCFGKIIKNTAAKTDPEHIRVVIDSNPGIPDRIAAILGDGQSPVPALVAGCRGLEKAGFFQRRLTEEKIHTLLPDRAQQSKIVAAIKDIKDTRPSRTKSEITNDLIEAVHSLIDTEPHGADAIIAGCTEIPLALGQEHLPVPYFDALTILARAAIRRAGKIPVE